MNIYSKTPFALLLLVLLTACSTTNLDYSLPNAIDARYGYSPELPLALPAQFKGEASKKTINFIEQLKTESGEPLKVVGASKVPNPQFKKPKLVLYNWITGEQINQGNGSFLMKYQLASETGKDSLELYVNHF